MRIQFGKPTYDQKLGIWTGIVIGVYSGGDTPTPTPTTGETYAIVDDISTFTGTYDWVWDKATDKWYRLNNEGEYEEYGIYADGIDSDTTTYKGKLSVVDGTEYKYNGTQWVEVEGESYPEVSKPITFKAYPTRQSLNADSTKIGKSIAYVVDDDQYYNVNYNKTTEGYTPANCYLVGSGITSIEYPQLYTAYNKDNSKWYVVNNLGEYEQYGVYADNIVVEKIEKSLTTNRTYVDLGFVPTSASTIEAEFEIVALHPSAGDNWVLGCFYTYNHKSTMAVTFRGARNNVAAFYASRYKDPWLGSVPSLNEKHKLTLAPNLFTLDDLTCTFSSSSYTPGTQNCYAGAASGGTSNGSFKWYSITHKNSSGDILNHFVPAEDTDGVPCLYDEITEAYFYPADTSKAKYEERTIKYGSYIGKLAIVNGLEYEFNGSEWVSLGEATETSGWVNGEADFDRTKPFSKIRFKPDISKNDTSVQGFFSESPNVNLNGYSYNGAMTEALGYGTYHRFNPWYNRGGVYTNSFDHTNTGDTSMTSLTSVGDGWYELDLGDNVLYWGGHSGSFPFDTLKLYTSTYAYPKEYEEIPTPDAIITFENEEAFYGYSGCTYSGELALITSTGNMKYRDGDEWVSFDPENSAIKYKTSDQQVVTPNSTVGYGANYLTNIYTDSVGGMIIFDNDVTALPTEAFRNKTIGEISIPDSVSTIGLYAFRSAKIGKLKFPDNIVTIDSYAFYGCDTSEVIIPNVEKYLKSNLSSPNSSIFYSRPNAVVKDLSGNTITAITAGEISIGKGFFNCQSIKSVNFGKAYGLDIYAFGDCSLEYIDIDPSNTDLKVDADHTMLLLPSQKAVVYTTTGFTTLPDEIWSITAFALRNRKNLDDPLVFPSTFLSMQENSDYPTLAGINSTTLDFRACTGMTGFTGYGVLRNNSVKNIYFPAGLKSMGDGYMPGTSIDTITFEDCSQLTSGINGTGYGNFFRSYLSNLTTLRMPNIKENFNISELTSLQNEALVNLFGDLYDLYEGIDLSTSDPCLEIEGNTSWYCDLGYEPTLSSKIEITTKMGDTANYTNPASISTTSSGNEGILLRSFDTGSRTQVIFGLANNIFSLPWKGKYTHTIDKNGYTRDGVFYSAPATATSMGKGNLRIGATWASSIASNGKYGEIKVWENDVLVRDYVPALDADDKACYHETITDAYFYMSGNPTVTLSDFNAPDPKTITMGSTLLGRLSDEDKAIATDKGWILA